MDLLDFTPKSDELTVVLKHPATGDVLKNDDKSDMTITLHAPHSKEYKKVLHEMTNKRLKKMQSKGKPDITAEELEEVSLDSLAKTTKGWNLTYNGEKPELSLDKAREIYDKVFWIKSQIEEASEELLGFMRA
tara:strand:+ start:4578 stop:4976 length:399 start_codon:yes stop_codon:yes gene_type:complete